MLGQGPRDASGGDLTLLSLAASALLNQGKSQGGGFAQRLEPGCAANLSRRWLLRAETGTASAVGVFFRWAFD